MSGDPRNFQRAWFCVRSFPPGWKPGSTAGKDARRYAKQLQFTVSGRHLPNRPDRRKLSLARLQVEAIVNAANTTLLGGGGVDGAIHRAAGPELLAECRTLGGCPTGQAKITRGYRLPAKWVIHTVGPVWRDGRHQEEDLLASCYRSCFALVETHGIRTLAFPSISAGAYGFPMDRAARIGVRETVEFLGRNAFVEKVLLVCFGENSFDIHLRALKEGLG